MNEESLVKDYFPDPPTPTSKQLPLGELIILVILSKCFRASSKITKFIFFDGYFSLYSPSFWLILALIASISGTASYTNGAS